MFQVGDIMRLTYRSVKPQEHEHFLILNTLGPNPHVKKVLTRFEALVLETNQITTIAAWKEDVESGCWTKVA